MKLGSPAFRRRVVAWIPSATVQRAKRIVDIMDDKTIEIYAKKKEALIKGDEMIVHQTGKGKDIMSILCASSITLRMHHYLIYSSESEHGS